MWSTTVVFASLLAVCLSNEATNESTTRNVAYDLEIGAELPVTLLTLTANVVGCYLDTPTGETIELKPVDRSSDKYQLRADTALSRCSVTILNIDARDHGSWRLHSESANGGVTEQIFAISLPSQDIRDELSEEDEWAEINLTPERYETSIGQSVSASITLYGGYETKSCDIRTPNGTEYSLDSISEISGVDRLEGSSISCGVTVNVVMEDYVGEWMLIAREVAWASDLVERRLPFTIYVEDHVNTTPKDNATVAAGNDFYIRLEKATELYETCALIAPNNDSSTRVEPDSRYVENCGFIVKSIEANDAGKWEIIYGNNVIYRAVVGLNVYDTAEESLTPTTHSLALTLDRPVNETLLPENAIYCVLENPAGLKVYEGFGRCQLSLPRALPEHAGAWTMKIGVSGKILMEEQTLFVSVGAAAPKATVTTNVRTMKPAVYVSCAVTSPYEVKACKFRKPNGEVLIANSGVGEGRYAINVTSESTTAGHEYFCDLQLNTPENSDLGLWRCAMETEQEAYYGFITVLCPWAMRDPAVAAQVEAEPVLKADRPSVSSVEGDSMVLSCHAAAPLTYCYFRAPNGTVFSVGSHTSTAAYSYAGAGLDAGECSVRFHSVSARDAGRWSCSAGHSVEESVGIAVEVHEQMVVSQYLDSDFSLVVSGQVFHQRALDYCRFVRIDGFGFSTDMALTNPNYEISGDLHFGNCTLRMRSPSILEHHPWTVVARLAGQSEEIAAVTPHSIVLPVLGYVRFPFAYFVLMIFGIVLIIISMMMIPRKNREWTVSRANVLRVSIRNSFRKTPLKDGGADKQTPIAA